MYTSDFDYHLQPELIAQTPIEPRDRSRLLVLHRQTGRLEHRQFYEVGCYLRPGDLLVANDSRVLPGRLRAHRDPTGGRVELLLLRPLDDGWWEALAKPAHRLKPGQRLQLVQAGGSLGCADAGRSSTWRSRGASEGAESAAAASAASAEVGQRTETGGVQVRFDAPMERVLAAYGQVPLPPYIHEPLRDPERYQTVYARTAGSAAAPTAGLHFTPELLRQLVEERGVQIAFLTLHVGPDTFRPVRAEQIEQHEMHAEFVYVPQATAAAVALARQEGRRVIAVGTTAVRALESAADVILSGGKDPFSCWTRLFIFPGYRFKCVGALITNFHLPRSTLLMLVSAFAGRELVLRAYEEAIRRRYRFYSFGDAMLIL